MEYVDRTSSPARLYWTRLCYSSLRRFPDLPNAWLRLLAMGFLFDSICPEKTRRAFYEEEAQLARTEHSYAACWPCRR